MITIAVKVKPYVKQYLVSHFGNPVDLSRQQDLYNALLSRLSKPSRLDEAKYNKTSLVLYDQTVEIIIPSRYFYRYGWVLTRTDTVTWGTIAEKMAKRFMREQVRINQFIMPSIKEAIIRFQDEFGYTEEIWPTDSIKKDFYRYRKAQNIKEASLENNIGNKIISQLLPFISESINSLLTNHKFTAETVPQKGQLLFNTNST